MNMEQFPSIPKDACARDKNTVNLGGDIVGARVKKEESSHHTHIIHTKFEFIGVLNEKSSANTALQWHSFEFRYSLPLFVSLRIALLL